jgi:hypothetical protein
MKFARPATKFAVLAIAGVTVLAACGKSSSTGGSGSTVAGPSGAFGSAPAQSGTPHAGTVTVAEPPGATPNWILPVIPGANNSVYTAFASGRRAQVEQRRQDRHHHDEEQLQVV